MKKTILLSLVTLLFTSSCGEILDNPGDQPVIIQEVRSLNGVKLISPSITDGRDEATYKEQQYTLGPSARLLLRLENLTEFSDSVYIDDENRMYFELSPLSGQDNDQIRAGLQLCPVLKNWMMLATWNNAHPFPGGTGQWATPGGDFLESECLVPETPSEQLPEDKIFIDVSNWFNHYSQSRDSNFGWVLVSRKTVRVFGDDHINHAPKLRWKKLP